jgi:23S rRNA (pseudouridine1915-N3)-methyltransferase
VRLTIAAIGRTKSGPERELAERYFDRAAKAGASLGLTFQLREIPESKASRSADRKREEAAALLAAIPAGAVAIAFDEHGEAIGSDAFANRIGRWRDDGTADVALFVGGADGLDPGLLKKARLVLAFGAMTWPHQLVRTMLAEQLYRAVTILSGHPYHRP